MLINPGEQPKTRVVEQKGGYIKTFYDQISHPEEDFVKLGAHLEQLRPLVEDFCQRHGFERIVGSSIGRYPRIRLQRCNDIMLWFDLWMCLDSEGRRFSYFTPDTPYELSAGASFVEQLSSRQKWEHYKTFLIWPSKPFFEVAAELPAALETGMAVLLKWDLDFLQKEGLRVQLE